MSSYPVRIPQSAHAQSDQRRKTQHFAQGGMRMTSLIFKPLLSFLSFISFSPMTFLPFPLPFSPLFSFLFCHQQYISIPYTHIILYTIESCSFFLTFHAFIPLIPYRHADGNSSKNIFALLLSSVFLFFNLFLPYRIAHLFYHIGIWNQNNQKGGKCRLVKDIDKLLG